MVSYMKFVFFLLLCPPTFTDSWCNIKILVLQFCHFSVSNDIFLNTYTYIIMIYQFISVFLVKISVQLIVKP